MLHYIKFFNFYLSACLGIVVIWMGGLYIPIGFAVYVTLYVAGDALLGDDTSEPALLNKSVLDLMLYSALPLSVIIFLSSVWLGTAQNFAAVTTVSNWLNYDLYHAKQNTLWWHKVSGVAFLGLLLGGVATVVAHELVHRVASPLAVCTGRWLLAFSFDANFSIEHVYNHHTKVATKDDPATAPRGRNVYVHFAKAFIGTQKAAWAIELKRLARVNQPILSVHNRCIRGWLMSAVLMLIAFILGGTGGLVMFVCVGINCKFILEVVNYMEHYGLVRDPRQPVKPRHSWNSNRKVSCWTMFNLPRHSHHHAQGAVPFEKLKAMPDSPTMIAGYITTIGIALIPPLWFKLMQPKLEEWDTVYASAREKEILAKGVTT
ncbi:alkane 1-monooxygenase [Alteromonas sediminis]|uniref:Alkane 1-monooxygenase n=1 Tax=Alteromonas sediminis TaxID=2259342 RepID=A0A3N5Y2U1_9ALTE|nr:alkane 1-monooxygenase [Alteromonas sediminis]RPJ66996.1 alkane 1-monooxygenase [Alteromonas sediminis]